ncbi:MAG: hypothetical protein RIC95_12755 [Vicingaceae bacterium]
MTIRLLVLIFCCFFLGSCEDEELEAPIPAYITIEDIEAKTQGSTQGSASDDIRDAWVYNGNQLLGVFELPATIPIQETGNVSLQVGAGIFNNSLSSDRALYPLYKFYTLDTTLLPEQEMTIVPVVEYQDNAIFDDPSELSIDDFDNGISFFTERHPNSDTIFFREQTNNVFEGTASGLAYLEPNMDFFEARTEPFSDIPRDGRAIYLEMDYSCTHDIALSIYTNDFNRQFSVINFRPTVGWKKAYVELGPVFSTLFNASNFSLAIGFTKPIGEVGKLYLDNVKIVRF